MAWSNKRFRRLQNWLHYGIALVFCLFLVLLTNRVVSDLDQFTSRPEINTFEQQFQDTVLVRQQEALQQALLTNTQQTEVTQQALNAAMEQARVEKEAFNNWIKTRNTIGNPEQDQEVISRTQQLDNRYAIQKNWATQLNDLKRQRLDLNNQLTTVDSAISENRQLTRDAYNKAYKQFELQAFLWRLALVLPILLLGIYFLLNFRHHRFWPLFLGFVLFAFYSFFFGLMPYLPWYGGYVRYTVGIILSILLGGYAIRSLRQYIEQKQVALTTDSIVRAQEIQKEVAEKSYEKHQCPSCEKDFLPPKWVSDGQKSAPVSNPKFCQHCGLTLFKNCIHCQTENFAHFGYCRACGSELEHSEELAN